MFSSLNYEDLKSYVRLVCVNNLIRNHVVLSYLLYFFNEITLKLILLRFIPIGFLARIFVGMIEEYFYKTVLCFNNLHLFYFMSLDNRILSR